MISSLRVSLWSCRLFPTLVDRSVTWHMLLWDVIDGSSLFKFKLFIEEETRVSGDNPDREYIQMIVLLKSKVSV